MTVLSSPSSRPRTAHFLRISFSLSRIFGQRQMHRLSNTGEVVNVNESTHHAHATTHDGWQPRNHLEVNVNEGDLPLLLNICAPAFVFRRAISGALRSSPRPSLAPPSPPRSWRPPDKEAQDASRNIIFRRRPTRPRFPHQRFGEQETSHTRAVPLTEDLARRYSGCLLPSLFTSTHIVGIPGMPLSTSVFSGLFFPLSIFPPRSG